MEFLFLPEFQPFTVALAVLAGLVGLEVLILFFGIGLFGFLDDVMPDIGEADAPETLSFAKALSFIGVGKVPVIMVIMALLATFGLAGTLIQNAASALFGTYLPLAAAVPAALAVSIPLTGRTAALLARFLPAEETSAVSADALIGREAQITYGEASHGSPATAKATDPKGGVHYIQTKAASSDEIFVAGDTAVIVSRADGFYFVAAPERTPAD